MANYPLMPLRDVVIFPYMVIPLFIGRKSSIKAIQHAITQDNKILLTTQKDVKIEDPGAVDLYQTGVLAKILQMMRMADNTIKILVEGEAPVTLHNIGDEDGFFNASYKLHEIADVYQERESRILMGRLKSGFSRYVKMTRNISSEVVSSLSVEMDPAQFAYTVAGNLQMVVDKKQLLLEHQTVDGLLASLADVLESENNIKEVERSIRQQVKKQMDKNQREYYLNEKIKVIQKELGKGDEEQINENELLRERIEKTALPKEAREKVGKEFARLKMMAPTSAEASVIRVYIETVLDVPWKKASRVNKDIQRAEQILNEDHYGLEEVKERILEYLAVQQRVKQMKSPILCLVGPPGVGKTSLGQSIARATGRKYVRMSLGGVRDEAEIRGHRRTYIGSMPGRIIQKMTRAEVVNPLFLLDEIDKMSMDFRGDPASALLEVLDPEQNHSFNDHYLELDYDLSNVMFVATSNSMNMPEPLIDRMEVIRIPGYTEDEKTHIATNYLIPKQLEKHGLKVAEFKLEPTALLNLIRYYTREAGVRGLERELAKIMRKVVRQLAVDKKLKKVAVNATMLVEYLDATKYRYGEAESDDQVGQVTGLAWTPVGGDLLTIESTLMPGKGVFLVTGQLGDVMKESTQAAMSVVRSRSLAFGIKTDDFDNKDMHIHVPEGAIPKDGPSAGVGMCTALVSILTGIAVRSDVAMTGEITLRGEVLPIGGLKEKLLAAHRGGIKIVIIPQENKKNLTKIPEKILSDIKIIPVRWIEEVLNIALVRAPQPLIIDNTRGKFKKNLREARAH